MKTKATGIFSSIKYELCVFLVLAVQALSMIIQDFYVGEYIRLYYLIDYSMGKTSRLLVGSIVKLFNPDPSPTWIAGFATVVVMLTLLFSSIVIGKVIRSTEDELKPQLLVFTAFLTTGIFTFYGFSVFLGMLDIWMFIAALLAVLCANNKYLRWFVPVLCAVGVLVHNAFAITYFPLVALTVFYLAVTGEKKAANSIVFVLSCLAAAALTFFVSFKGNETVTLSYEQLYETLRNRGGYTYDEHGIETVGFYLLKRPPESTGATIEMAAQVSPFALIKEVAKYSLQDISLSNAIAVISFGVVVLAAFWAIWIKCIRNAQTKSRKFVYLCFMLSVLVIPAGMLVAADFIRWFQGGIITQFGLVMLMFMKKDEPFEKATVQLREFFSDKKLLLAIMFIVYATAQAHGITV